MAELTEMTDDELQNLVSHAVKDAIDFIDSEISPSRVLSQKYFDGFCEIGSEEGRSSVVSTKVRDTIRAIKPSLQRVFASTDKSVEFVPRNSDDVGMSETATQYVNYIFEKNGSFNLLSDAFHDALVKKVGILKAYYEDIDEQTIHDYTGLDQQAFDFLESQSDLELLSQEVEMVAELSPEGMEVETPIIDARFARKTRKGEIKIESVPSEEFFINRDARSLEDFYVVGHRTEMRVGDLVAMGYDFDEVSDLSGMSDGDDSREIERSARRGYSTSDNDEDAVDPSMKLIQITECYMRVDQAGTGIPTLHRFTLGGGQYKMLDYQPTDHIPFAAFEIDPEPHTFFGRSICDLIKDDADASTSILRGILDNVAMTNSPRLAVNSQDANIDDVLNNEVGAVIRVRGQPSAAVHPVSIPFVAGQTLSALQYMDQLVETKTGVKSDSQLHHDSLQSTTAIAVQGQMQAAAMQIETMARNLAEGGMKQLFKLLLSLVIAHQDKQTMMRLNNQFVPIDPRSFHSDMDMTCNVGLGTGREDERQQALMQTMQIQQQILTQFGQGNPLVTLTQFRNTLADVLAASGVRNADRYFQPLTMEQEQAMQQQQAQQAQQQAAQQTDPTQMLMQVEQMKAQQKGQSDQMKMQLEAQKMQVNTQMRQQEMMMADDRARDGMVQDLAVKVAEILGKYGTAIDVAGLKAEQDKPRAMNGYSG